MAWGMQAAEGYAKGVKSILCGLRPREYPDEYIETNTAAGETA